MHPEPLAGVGADDLFEMSVDAAGVGFGVAGSMEGRIELEDVAILFLGPEREAGDDGGARVSGDLGKAGGDAGGYAEEGHEDTFGGGDVLVDQDADGFIGGEGSEDATGVVPFPDDTIAREGAQARGFSIEQRVVESADNNMHRLGEKAVGKGAEFPIAEVGSGEEHAFAVGLGGLEVLETVVTNPGSNVLGRNRPQTGEGDEQAGQGAKAAVDDAPAGVFIKLREGEDDVAPGDAAELGDEEVEQPNIEAGEGEGKGAWSDAQCAEQGAHKGPFQAVAEGAALLHEGALVPCEFTRSNRRRARARPSRRPRPGRA